MNAKNTSDSNSTNYAAFIGIDWADQQHVWALQAAGQTQVQTGTLKQKPEAIGTWVAQLRQRFGGQPVAIALEQSRGALLHGLAAYDFLVLYPLPSTTMAEFRAALRPSGAKDDPHDAGLILELLLKHRDRFRPWRPDTEQTRLLGRLVEDRRKAVNLRARHVQALQASLKEYYPQALDLLQGNVTSRLAADLLAKWPTLPEFQKAKPAAIRKFYYGHNVRSPQVIQQALELAHTAQPLTSDPAIVESGQCLSQMHVQLIQSLNPAIATYDRRIQQVFDAHPEGHLFSHLPGAGPALAPRLLAFFGTDRSRYTSAEQIQSYTGIAPATVSSGKSRVSFFRVACPKFDRQTFHEFARLSVAKSAWAKSYVDYYTGRGKKYHATIRALAFKWIRVLFRCWQTGTRYDEQRYLAALQRRGSVFAGVQV